MGTIDRSRVRNSFDRQAAFYEETVVVQKRVRTAIISQVRENHRGNAPRSILDVGAGTGMLLCALRNIYPDAFLAGVDLAPGMGRTAAESLHGGKGMLLVEADAEALPFADNSLDLVLSTSTFQWLNVLEDAFHEASRVLSPGGGFHFALFGGDTLRELRYSYKAALKIHSGNAEDRTHTFFSLHDVESALKKTGFCCCWTKRSIEMEYHPDVSSLLRSLRRIGAGSASRLTGRGLAGSRVMTEMMKIYHADYRCLHGVPATYEVIYGYGIKPRK